MRSVITVTVVFLFTFSLSAQSDFDKVEIKATPVNGNVYMLEGAGGNIGVSVGEDGLLMIDDQFALLADKIKAALASLNPGQLKFLLNTHVHSDHVGGNESFGGESIIIAHENIRSRMLAPQPELIGHTEVGPKGWPVITFESSLSIHFNGEEIKVLHYPSSHTDGDAVIHFTKSNVVHMGDLMFSGLFPFIDLNRGGNVDGYIKSVNAIIKKLPEDVKLIPGHGPLSVKSDLVDFHTMMVETTRIIRTMKENGKSVEEIQATGLGEEWQKWSWAFITTEKWIETVFNSPDL